jgi:hypothetical protein
MPAPYFTKEEIYALLKDSKVYNTLLEATSLTYKPADGTPFQVSSVTDPDNAGFYSFQSSEPNGVRYEQPYVNAADLDGLATIRLDNIASDLTVTEQDDIKTKLSIGEDGAFIIAPGTYGDNYILKFYDYGNDNNALNVGTGEGNVIFGRSNDYTTAYENIVFGNSNLLNAYTEKTMLIGDNHQVQETSKSLVVGDNNKITGDGTGQFVFITGIYNETDTGKTSLLGDELKSIVNAGFYGQTNFVTGFRNELYGGNWSSVMGSFNYIGEQTDTDGIVSALIAGRGADWSAYSTNKPLLLIGNGVVTDNVLVTPKNAFAVLDNGEVVADGLTNALIDASPSSRVLVTRDYIQSFNVGPDDGKVNVRLDNVATDLSTAEQDAFKANLNITPPLEREEISYIYDSATDDNIFEVTDSSKVTDVYLQGKRLGDSEWEINDSTSINYLGQLDHGENIVFISDGKAPVTHSEISNDVTTSRTLTNADHGKILTITANVTLTIPTTGLRVGFTCELDATSTGQATIQGDGGGVALDSPNGTILDANKTCTIYRRAIAVKPNEYRIKGETRV